MNYQDDLDRLVRTHLDASLRFATRLTGNLERAEDLVQDALVRVARSWRTFEGRSEFRTWFYTIIVNQFRSQQNRTNLTLVDVDGSEQRDSKTVGPLDWAIGQDLRAVIAGLVSKLPSRQREVIVLHLFEEMSIEEIQAVLGISSNNVRSQLHLGRSWLRRKLEPLVEGVK